jgi:F0F1-type ATP synthase assembly protein I
VVVEVDVLGRPGREAGAFEDDELGAFDAGTPLLAPRRAAADDAPVDEDDALHRCHKGRDYSARRAEIDCYKQGGMLPVPMAAAASSSPHSLATASGLLLGSLVLAMLVGAFLGWLLGSAGIGLLVGAIVGIPLATAVVYGVYSRAGS